MLQINKKWGSFWEGRKLEEDILEKASLYCIEIRILYFRNSIF